MVSCNHFPLSKTLTLIILGDRSGHAAGKSRYSAKDAGVPWIVAITRMKTGKWEFVVSQRQAQLLLPRVVATVFGHTPEAGAVCVRVRQGSDAPQKTP